MTESDNKNILRHVIELLFSDLSDHVRITRYALRLCFPPNLKVGARWCQVGLMQTIAGGFKPLGWI